MKDLLMWTVVIIGALIILVWALGEVQDKQANRLYARAHLVEANSSARQDFLAGLMPYTIVGLATIGGSIAAIALTYGLVAIVTAMVTIGLALINRPTSTVLPRITERIIERRTILVLQPGQHSRKEIYKLMSGEE